MPKTNQGGMRVELTRLTMPWAIMVLLLLKTNQGGMRVELTCFTMP